MPSPLLPHSSTAALLLMLLLVTHAPTSTHAQTALENGNVFENIKYTSPRGFDANAKLKDETASSSVILWKSCSVRATMLVYGTFDPSKTFATSLYFMFDALTFTSYGQFIFIDLQPNSYVHAVGTRGSKVRATLFDIRPTTESNNITTFIDNSIIGYDKVNGMQLVNLEVPNSSPYIVTHLRNAKLTSAYSIFQKTTCTKGSTIFLEQITCTACRYDLIILTDISSITQQSAIILKEVNIVDHEYPNRDSLIRTGSTVNIDASSVLAMIDVDLTNDFTDKKPLPLFHETKLRGDGAIVLLRIKMGPSGLKLDPQPVDNSNFWVVAKNTASQEMTAAELREAKLNVNTNNVFNWDGTGANGQCVEAGLALPGTATYTFITIRCVAACPQGNYLQPACTPRAVCTGVPNCQACYAHPKTLCLECLPHTTPINGERGCQCPIRECVTCPTATLCTQCTKDYKYSPEDNACFHCTIDKCSICREDRKCSTCEDGYKVYNNQCIPCGIGKCEYCKEAEKCFHCIPNHKLTANGKSCFHCTVPNCTECSADGICGICDDEYSLTDNKTCVRCSIDVPKCTQCETDGACLECTTDYKPANAGTVCFHCTTPFCTECSADGVCGFCNDGYYLLESESTPTDNKCVRCSIDVPKCDACKTDGNCSQCITDHKPANAGTDCFYCTVPFCTECSADGVCGFCDEGYYLLESQSTPTDNKCVRCSIDVSNCRECKVDGICSQCNDGYTLSTDGSRCTPCHLVDGCQRCDLPNVCALCKPGMSVNENGGACTPCDIGNCTSCSGSNNACALCTCGMVPADDGEKCVLCRAGHCRYCDPSSGGGTKCAECVEGYEASARSTRVGGVPHRSRRKHGNHDRRGGCVYSVYAARGA